MTTESKTYKAEPPENYHLSCAKLYKNYKNKEAVARNKLLAYSYNTEPRYFLHSMFSQITRKWYLFLSDGQNVNVVMILEVLQL